MNESKTLSPSQEKKIDRVQKNSGGTFNKVSLGSAPTKNEQKKELVILRGVTTSQINQAPKATNPYPARVFLKVENYQEDIPVFFRIREVKENCSFHSRCSEDCRYKSWTKPKIKPNSLIECRGYFNNPTNGSDRPSFTAYSYNLLACPHSQKKPYHCPVDCSCLKGKKLREKAIREPNRPKFYFKVPAPTDFITKREELEKAKHA